MPCTVQLFLCLLPCLFSCELDMIRACTFAAGTPLQVNVTPFP
uniref:Uncharacterized protein n=1 Tax=Rhizophora mucronata TaxID=61149 RepID=A0A2P2QJI8_RHIMU